MSSWALPCGLLVLVLLVQTASRHHALRRLFVWLPIPLWCYGLPMLLHAVGLLPASHSSYQWIAEWILPMALGLLLVSIDVSALARLGAHAMLAMAAGAMGIMLGGVVMVGVLRAWLAANAWQGIGLLTATWTGGSLNMLALQQILAAPQSVFAPLVVVDTLVAYSWMACLMAGKGWETTVNRWLGVRDVSLYPVAKPEESSRHPWSPHQLAAIGLVVVLTLGSRWTASLLPRGSFMASISGWTILLVTTGALLLACVPSIRRFGQAGERIGYAGLYLMLTALGAQASVRALAATPIWIVIGFGVVGCHVLMLLAAGRLFRLPLSLLATASQANVGGVVSAPLVGAVYHPKLAPVGLVLAVAGNALGTYLGLCTATVGRVVLGQ